MRISHSLILGPSISVTDCASLQTVDINLRSLNSFVSEIQYVCMCVCVCVTLHTTALKYSHILI
jgi:hypothetical protein